MYKACIFDLDGTLTDTLESLTYSVNETLRELELGQITPEQCKSFVGHGARRLIEDSIQAAGGNPKLLIEKGMETYGRIFKVHCTYKVAPYDGIVEMLEELGRMGIKLAVLSNKPHMQTRDVVGTFFDADTFLSVQGQREEIPRKPDPTGIYCVLEELGVSKDDCLYIGDSDVDMVTGENAGVTTVGVSWGFRTKEVLEAHRATYIVDKPEEIISIVKGAESYVRV